MNRHATMNPFTMEWWTCILTVAAGITLLVNLPKYAKWARSPLYPKILGLLLLCNLLIENGYAIWMGNWDFRSNLPLHLCGISGLIGIYLLLNFHWGLAQVFFYFGLTGAFHSLLTPEFDLGNQGFFYYAYFISHGGLLLTCFYMIKHHGFKPEQNSWLKTFFIIQLIAIVIGTFDHFTGANYMYLVDPPIADNPLIVGKWPWYLLLFEGLALIHFFAFYRLFRLIK